MNNSGAQKNSETLLISIVIAAVLGLICGALFGTKMTSISWVGTFFLNCLKMTIVPLVVSAIICSVGSLGDIRNLGKIGFRTVFYYTCTTAIAVAIGLVMVNIINPGDGISLIDTSATQISKEVTESSLSDIPLSLVSPNLIQAASNTKLLPIITFSLLLGAAITTLDTKNNTIDKFFNNLNAAMMQIITWLMYLAPVGIFSLISSKLGGAGGGEAFWSEITAVGKYVFTVIVGLGIHCLFLFCLLLIMTNRGQEFLKGMSRALLTAFGTASSSATLPVTMECALQTDMNQKSVRFVLPLGATINMDGTALYEAVAVMFIAQAYGIELTTIQQVIVFITATFAAIGAAGIPQAGLVTMVLVLSAVNLPTEGIGILLAVDWFLDRFRTATNVWGDSVGGAIVEKYL